MSRLIAVYGSQREATEYARQFNETRKNGEVYGCRRTKDGRWEVICVVTDAPNLALGTQ